MSQSNPKSRELFQEMDHTYASRENVLKAVKKKGHDHLLTEFKWLIAQNAKGRHYIVFIGNDAVNAGVFHAGYCVAN